MTKLLHLALDSILIDRPERQRQEIDISDIGPSIAARGVVTPIIVEAKQGGKYKLIAGERRFTAAQSVGLMKIPAHLLSDLSQPERLLIEYEENAKRKPLTWQEDVRAIMSIQSSLRQENPEINLTQISEKIGFSLSKLNQYNLVGKNIEDPRVLKLESFNQAVNMISKMVERKAADVITELMESANDILEEPEEFTLPPVPKSELTPAEPSLHETKSSLECQRFQSSVKNLDFLSWSEVYSGPTFNFIHCDFPYGANVFGGKQSGRETAEHKYNDDPQVYWDLLKAFCENLDKFMSPSGHLMFWFSMEYYTSTLNFFAQNAPSLLIQPRPLVWLKSDNIGIVPDVRRQPRWITETAFFGIREDRPLSKVVSNAIAAPTDRKWHPSTKPEPVLRHFFQMFVDDSTKLFDPTCGSASALRAAETLGAKHVFGLEKNLKAFEHAEVAMKEFRIKRKLAGEL